VVSALLSESDMGLTMTRNIHAGSLFPPMMMRLVGADRAWRADARLHGIGGFPE
jgi:hypothetical protein